MQPQWRDITSTTNIPPGKTDGTTFVLAFKTGASGRPHPAWLALQDK